MPVSTRTWGVVAVLTVLLAVILSVTGQPLWCQQGDLVPWSFDVWSSHNSQHLIDPYAMSHILHGVVFYGALRVALGDEKKGLRLILAVLIEAAWELLENSPIIIDRYRENTMSLDYYGDSVANVVSDLWMCIGGYAATSRATVAQAVGGFIALELISALWIRDNLLLNVLMLLYPLESVKQWQMAL